jgi:molecular chaperone HscB
MGISEVHRDWLTVDGTYDPHLCASTVNRSMIKPSKRYCQERSVAMTHEAEVQRWHCWSCKTLIARKASNCSACRVLQAPDPSLSHFERFGVPKKFALETAELTRAFRNGQRAIHPDRFVSATDRERRHALEHSTIMNDAYRILKEPMTRAGYLLGLLGLDVNDEKSTQLSSSFLIMIMEMRESLEELTGPDAHVERRRIQQSIVLEYEEGLARLGSRLDALPEMSSEILNTLGQLHAQLMYLRRVLEEVERLEAEGDTHTSGNLERLDPLRPETFERKGT